MHYRKLWDRKPLHYFWIMPEMHDNELRKLFQHAGRPPMGTDLSDRIMARVAVTPIMQPLEVKPLIGKAGWSAIAGMFIILLALLFNAAGISYNSQAPSILDPLLANVPNLHFSLPAGPWIYWAAGAAACALVFTLMDRALERSIK